MNTRIRPVVALQLCMCVALIAGLTARNAWAQPASAAPPKPDPAAVESLLAAAAEDFKRPSSTRPFAIRKARVGYFPERGTGRYLLCGSFKPADDKGSEWVQFATIKTSPYEQWIGGMAEAQCANKRIKWYAADHADELMQRVQSR